jgi:hypothetical protein
MSLPRNVETTETSRVPNHRTLAAVSLLMAAEGQVVAVENGRVNTN